MVEKFNTDFVEEAIEETPYTELPARDFLHAVCRLAGTAKHAAESVLPRILDFCHS